MEIRKPNQKIKMESPKKTEMSILIENVEKLNNNIEKFIKLLKIKNSQSK